MKTAVEWLQEALEDTILTHEQIMQTIGLFEQAKEMEREQITEHGVKCYVSCCGEPDRIGDKVSEGIYNTTFKSE